MGCSNFVIQDKTNKVKEKEIENKKEKIFKQKEKTKKKNIEKEV